MGAPLAAAGGGLDWAACAAGEAMWEVWVLGSADAAEALVEGGGL